MSDYDKEKKPIIGELPKQDEDVQIPGGYYNLATGCYEIPDTSDMMAWRNMERALGVLKTINKLPC